jgi:catechol 2,3-dioxygenase
MKVPNTKLKPRERNKNPIDPRVDIGHVHMKTANIQRIYDFYVGVLGFDVVVRMPNALFLSAGGYHHDLAFNTWESENGASAPDGTTGLYHIAIRYPDRATLGDALHRLMKAEWPLEGVNDHGTHEALYLRDPDDNGLELYWDRAESEWPLDSEGHLTFEGRNMDIEGLLAEGKKKL